MELPVGRLKLHSDHRYLDRNEDSEDLKVFVDAESVISHYDVHHFADAE